MRILPNGAMQFEDVFELTYELLNEMELEVKANGYVFDPNRNTILSFNGNMVKASINPHDIKYAGQGEIVLDLLGNTKLITNLFGYYLEKKQAEGMPFVSYFNEESGDEIKYSALTVKFNAVSSATTAPYHNRCLKFIHMIFLLEEQLVDLSNFDLLEGA